MRKTRLLYGISAPFYDFTRKPFLRGRADALRACAVRDGESVLEIGCGTGEMLARLAGASGSAVGIDLSPSMLKRARRKLRAGTPLLLADAELLPFARAFDCILYSYSLSMLQDWRASLSLAVGCLREGGRLVVLDFGDMRSWGPAGRLVKAWLYLHGVRPPRGIEQFLADRGMDVGSTCRAGGWWDLIVARRRKEEPLPRRAHQPSSRSS